MGTVEQDKPTPEVDGVLDRMVSALREFQRQINAIGEPINVVVRMEYAGFGHRAQRLCRDASADMVAIAHIMELGVRDFIEQITGDEVTAVTPVVAIPEDEIEGKRFYVQKEKGKDEEGE